MKKLRFEPITVGLIFACYLGLGIATTVLSSVSLVLGFVATIMLIALHSSLQHEALHGHPTRSRLVNEMLVFPAVGLLVPYQRFRDSHIAHHHDEILTDPYDDPESNFLDPMVWAQLARWKRAILRANNTLLGRILLGPAMSEIAMIRGDLKLIAAGDHAVARAWILHALGVIPVLAWVLTYAKMPLPVYVVAGYLGFGVLKIRTYLEHRAFANAPGRTVVIEDRGLLSFLFLNNNFHAVHHANPKAPWYRLPGLYWQDRQQYLDRNSGYFYPNYRVVFAKYLFHAKDPVPHPLRPVPKPR